MFDRKRRLRNQIEAYRNKLASSETVTIDETIVCHTAILALDPERETAVRSIQTLANLGASFVISPAVRELASLSKEWPSDKVNGWPQILVGVLRDLHLE